MSARRKQGVRFALPTNPVFDQRPPHLGNAEVWPAYTTRIEAVLGLQVQVPGSD